MGRPGKRRLSAVVAAAALVGAVAVGSGGGASAAEEDRGVRGKFSAVMMVHTKSRTYGDLPGVKAWDGKRRNGATGTYRSIACTGNAPVNNISSDLPSYGTRVKGSRAPSSMRAHPFGFKVRKHKGRWEMLGAIRFTVCKLGPGPTASDDPVPDSRKPQIVVGFRARFERHTAELVRFTGRFRIVRGTQRYNDLTGSGEIAGYLFCFAPAGCTANGGKLLDGQFVMSGRYHDPTPDLAAG